MRWGVGVVGHFGHVAPAVKGIHGDAATAARNRGQGERSEKECMKNEVKKRKEEERFKMTFGGEIGGGKCIEGSIWGEFHSSTSSTGRTLCRGLVIVDSAERAMRERRTPSPVSRGGYQPFHIGHECCRTAQTPVFLEQGSSDYH